jgi:hypothetical protein
MDVTGLEPIGFGDFLVLRSAITEQQLLDALADHWVHRRELSQTLVERGFLPASELERLTAEFSNLQIVYV